jgi:hypothetical protein
MAAGFVPGANGLASDALVAAAMLMAALAVVVRGAKARL